MHTIISAHDGWQTQLAPRLLIGMWHPRFLAHAKEILPYCRRSYIGEDPGTARKYFWKDVDAFSMWFGSLTTADGERYVSFVHTYVFKLTIASNRFRNECKAAGKSLMVWTVNDPACMMEAVRWDVDAILTEMDKEPNVQKLKGFERVKRIHVTMDAFTVENDCLTPTLKIRRSVDLLSRCACPSH